MHENTVKVTCVVCSMATALVISSLDIEDESYRNGINNGHTNISIKKLNVIQNKVDSNELTSQLGRPDEFKTLKNADGKRTGTAWIYYDKNANQLTIVRQKVSTLPK